MTVEQAELVRSRERSSADEPDWDAVYADQLPRIYAYLRFRLGSDTDAEDLTSRTFEKAWRSRHAYRRDLAAFSTWLCKIAQNVATDHIRSRRTHAQLDAALDLIDERTPAQDAEYASDLERLTQLIARLPERERELIALKYGADIGNQAIARLTGLRESNVGTILHRAVQALRSKW